jgi:hypothetical protein
MITLAIDPSGNFTEGKGHTGIAGIEGNDWNTVFTKSVNASDYETRFDYWTAVKKVIQDYVLEGTPIQIVIENYVVRANGFTTGKMPETAMLIGVLVYFCDMYKIPMYFQSPSQAKTRFRDDLIPSYLPQMKVTGGNRYYLGTKLTNDHERDALKHLLYFKRYKEYKI